jgi:adenylate cyclase
MEMQAEMETVSAQMRDEGLPFLEMGIGLNAGQVVVGNIGSETRAKYGVVGAPVNLTQRIQEFAKGGEVVISDSIYDHARECLKIKESLEVQLKGLQERVRLHVLGGFNSS